MKKILIHVFGIIFPSLSFFIFFSVLFHFLLLNSYFWWFICDRAMHMKTMNHLYKDENIERKLLCLKRGFLRWIASVSIRFPSVYLECRCAAKKNTQNAKTSTTKKKNATENNWLTALNSNRSNNSIIVIRNDLSVRYYEDMHFKSIADENCLFDVYGIRPR